ncbi:MAG: beta-lactamase family protein [Gemmatimonadota bacterium]|nr:beta-lactamase family protein [Gemmatimonadota bacterium]MDH3422263.1 beta-lactamase family protein [Gemmatimonadota bacterium]
MAGSLASHAAASLLLVAIAAPLAGTAQHFPNDEDLGLMLRYLVEDDRIPGIVIGLLEADGTTRVASYGSGGPGANPLGPQSLFEIGSMTKTLTGALLADMVTRGEVALADPVATYLGDEVAIPSRGGTEITLLHLATHTSGLPGVPSNFPRLGTDPFGAYTLEDLYSFLESHELSRDPGTQAEYANYGVGLLGQALARAAGQPYRDLLRIRVLEPLGMSMTGYAEAADWQEGMPRGHRAGAVFPYWSTTPAIEAAGGLRSNAEDLLLFLAANVGEPRTDLERAMRLSHEPRSAMSRGGIESEVGLTWETLTLSGRRIIRHTGTSGGFSTMIAFEPNRQVGIIVLTNSVSGGGAIGLALDLLVHEPPRSTPQSTVESEVLGDFVGEYALSAEQSVYVRFEPDAYLTVQAPNSERFRMYAESDSTFFVKREAWDFAFERDDQGAVSGLVVTVNGNDQAARKVSDETPPPQQVAGTSGSGGLEGVLLRAMAAVSRWGSLAWIAIGLSALALIAALGRGMIRRFGRSNAS